MNRLLELGGVWLARLHAVYGMAVLLIPTILFAHLALLAAVVWAVASHARGRQTWPSVPASVRRWVRLAVEVVYGLIPPIPVPAERHIVATALLDAQSNLATCALILALYQHQWEATNRAWSLRARPDILATLYQIGFARSKPHGAPRSNAFGSRVRLVYEQPWLGELLDTTPRPRG